MRTYSLFIEDERYSAPTLVLLEAGDDNEARAAALAHLEASMHHLAVELRADDTLVLELRRPDAAA